MVILEVTLVFSMVKTYRSRWTGEEGIGLPNIIPVGRTAFNDVPFQQSDTGNMQY